MTQNNVIILEGRGRCTRTHARTRARAGARGGEVRICGGRENFLSFYNLLSYYVLICFCRTDISFCHANKALTIQIELGGRGGVSERERESRLLSATNLRLLILVT